MTKPLLDTTQHDTTLHYTTLHNTTLNPDTHTHTHTQTSWRCVPETVAARPVHSQYPDEAGLGLTGGQIALSILVYACPEALRCGQLSDAMGLRLTP